MISSIIKVVSIIFSICGLGFIMKLLRSKEEQQKQLKLENENMQQNLKINKEVSNMSFDDKSDFLLSKQRNKTGK